jgi:hypothetical protein
MFLKHNLGKDLDQYIYIYILTTLPVYIYIYIYIGRVVSMFGDFVSVFLDKKQEQLFIWELGDKCLVSTIMDKN